MGTRRGFRTIVVAMVAALAALGWTAVPALADDDGVAVAVGVAAVATDDCAAAAVGAAAATEGAAAAVGAAVAVCN